MNRRSLILGAAALPLSTIPIIESSAHGADVPVVPDYHSETWFWNWDDMRGALLNVQALPYAWYGWTWSNAIEQRIYPTLPSHFHPYFVLPPLSVFSFVRLEGRDTPSMVTDVHDDGSYTVLHTPASLWAPSSIRENAW